MIKASAPGKLMLFGEHSVVYGEPCIVTAVDERVTALVEKNGEDVFQLTAPDLGLTAYSKTIDDLGKKELPKSVAFVEMCYKRFLERYPQQEGVVVNTASDFSAQFGFGSSSAVTVAFAKAVTSLYGIKLSNKELFNLCYQAVLDVQGVSSGFDIAAAIWGGTLYYTKPAKVVEIIPQCSMPLVVGYTGIKADTPTLIRMVKKMEEDAPDRIRAIFQDITNIVDQAKNALEKKDWTMLGKLMTKNQEALRQLQVSSAELENLIAAADQAGAWGAKLSGAGVGDCMIALAKDKVDVEQAINRAGGVALQVGVDAVGVRLEV